MNTAFDPQALPIRAGLARERERAWQRLTEPGTWWIGAERRAIAAEARHAHACALCRRRKSALSPYAITGSHDSATSLPPAVIDLVHRVATDAGRLKRDWVESLRADGLSDEQYVEAIAVVALITALDTFDHALGLPQRPLPHAREGEPSCRRPPGARIDMAWVPTVAPEQLTPEDLDPYAVHGAKNIHRALSLVPQEVLNFFDLDVELYLKDDQIRDFAHDHRALSHPQMELMAGRVSVLNGCYY